MAGQDGLAQVRALLADEQWKSAELLCGLLLPTWSGDDATAGRVALGDACAGQRQYHRALACYKQALGKGPFADCCGNDQGGKVDGKKRAQASVELRVKLAQTCIAIGTCMDSEAVEHLRAISTGDRPVKADMMMAGLFRRRGSHQSAAAAYWRVLERSPYNLEAVRGWLEVQCHFICHCTGTEPEGDRTWSDAVRELRQLHTPLLPSGESPVWCQDPRAAGARVVRWTELQKLRTAGAYQEALTAARTLAGYNDTTCIPVLSDMCECYYRLHLNQEALGTCYRQRARDPSCVAGMDVLAMLLSKHGRRSELQRLATELVAKAPHAEEPWLVAALARPPGAGGEQADRTLLEYAEHAAALNPCSSRGYLIAAKELLRCRRFEDARRHYLAAQRVSRDVTSYQGLVSAYVSGHMPNEALHSAKEAVARFPDSPHSHAMLGLVYRRQQRLSMSKKAYAEALRLDPQHVDATIGMANIDYEEGRQQQAINRLADMERTEHCLIELGRMHLRRSSVLEARRAFEEALSANPNSAKARAGLRNVRKMSGEQLSDDEE
eukprot:TRINITY_DN70881_c0_g1_i1.p1 TRINITY_DN70881_c0_g1~~TRINITY_DN70881_c0_g1_i1.p1  ORF type:complete len:552 (+),score=170.29 TRINITY_DN70881_c0_g1_i1:97-1752(+)